MVKLGGPVYRIGVGGGSASSVHVQGMALASLYGFGVLETGGTVDYRRIAVAGILSSFLSIFRRPETERRA